MVLYKQPVTIIFFQVVLKVYPMFLSYMVDPLVLLMVEEVPNLT